ncbi:MAG: bacillithiol biosynthesis deacetylase BshB1 [Candidatus Kapabacteria bacterium]|nr:bacillithiol biosynthesis deacetylase BshB1 [Candidatus Kapabacteria bacterium]
MNDINKFQVDVLAIGAHPDDIELACGGTVAKFTEEGYSVAIVDCTNGELGSRGNAEIRAIEAKNGAEILGVKFRENLGLPDGKLTVNDESVEKMIVMIRKYRPKIVLVNPPYERHPDHEASHFILRKAMFKSGLIKVETEYDGVPQTPLRIRKMFCYMQSYEFPRKPDFYVDITSTFEKKMNAIKAYTSQVWVPGLSDPNGPVTRLSRPEFLEELEARAIYFGTQIGVRFAEAFYSIEPLGFKNLSGLF